MPAQTEKENVAPVKIAPGGKTVEQIYQKKTQLEHILLRPDTYIGSVEKETDTLWVWEQGRLVQRAVTYVPGLYKIFDEILVNAADNKQRDSNMDTLRVEVDVEAGSISVLNNGQGIPVELHKDHGVYVPELIFGHLLTSSNYDDSQKKTVGGRNGYGAKLANIFSKEFIVETQDRKRGLHYVQRFADNMATKGKPTIKACDKPDWTKVTFRPDLAKFGMTTLDDDIVALIKKRVHDVAGTAGKGIKVFLNGERVKISSFKEYLDLYLTPEAPRIHEVINERWEVCVSLSDGHFQQVSFVNSICTTKGGKHVVYLADQVCKKVAEQLSKKHKKLVLKPQHIKNHLWVFVNALIENPAFDSQTKGALTTNKSSFGSSCDLSEAFMKKVVKSSILESIVSWAEFKNNKDLNKTDGKKKTRLTGIEKLDDANLAGSSKHASECTLILTEGDSAKSLAVAGLSIVGRDRYGVFPLKGKLMNVREASPTQVANNAEITAIKQILGLRNGHEYTDTKSLRYGHVMLMTDQDQDGSHIKGLVINLFLHFWPSLLRIPGFLVEFITPIVKARRANHELAFYTLPEYQAWKEHAAKGWKIKYYKGLGTSDSVEAKAYFKALERHRKQFEVADAEDQALVDMAFNKKKADDRKVWIEACEPGTFLDQSVQRIKYSEFINKELVLFSVASNVRAIPSVVDGLKPGQRKILWSCFKRNLVKEIKVAQLAGYVSEHSAYHHGEASLASTIVGLAQNFVGSNNLNLLLPNGQFGTREQGGKNAASARYIFTALHPVTRMVFPVDDDSQLKQLNEDGQLIEPEWFCPVLPMVLVNGAAGIGTGWSTSLPNFNPRDIVDNLKRLLEDRPLLPMHPWYRGFTGAVVPLEAAESCRSYSIEGLIFRSDATSFHIAELPVGEWTQDYKTFLESLITAGTVKDFKEYHTEEHVSFLVQMATQEAADAVEAAGAMSTFKLTTSMKLNNIVLFDRNGKLKKYAGGALEILREFYDVRLELYHLRKAYLTDKLSAEVRKLENKVRFITAVIADQLKIRNVPKKKILAELQAQKYDKFLKKKVVAHEGEEEVEVGEDAQEVAAQDNDQDLEAVAGYDYLLSMSLWSLSAEKVLALKKEKAAREADLELLQATTPKQMWAADLGTFLKGLDAHEAALRAAADADVSKANPKKKGAGALAVAGGGARLALATLVPLRDPPGVVKPERKKKAVKSEDGPEGAGASAENVGKLNSGAGGPKAQGTKRKVSAKKEKKEKPAKVKQEELEPEAEVEPPRELSLEERILARMAAKSKEAVEAEEDDLVSRKPQRATKDKKPKYVEPEDEEEDGLVGLGLEEDEQIEDDASDAVEDLEDDEDDEDFGKPTKPAKKAAKNSAANSPVRKPKAGKQPKAKKQELEQAKRKTKAKGSGASSVAESRVASEDEAEASHTQDELLDDEDAFRPKKTKVAGFGIADKKTKKPRAPQVKAMKPAAPEKQKANMSKPLAAKKGRKKADSEAEEEGLEEPGAEEEAFVKPRTPKAPRLARAKAVQYTELAGEDEDEEVDELSEDHSDFTS